MLATPFMPHAQNLWGFLLLIGARFVFALLCFLVHTQFLVAVCSVRNEDDGLEGRVGGGAGRRQGLQAEETGGATASWSSWSREEGKSRQELLNLTHFKLYFGHYRAVGKMLSPSGPQVLSSS